MKNLTLTVLLLSIFFACKDNSKTVEKAVEKTNSAAVVSDSAAIAETLHNFFKWYNAFETDSTKNINFLDEKDKYLIINELALKKFLTAFNKIRKDLILLTTTEGVAAFNPNTRDIRFFAQDSLLKITSVGSFYKNGILYIASEKGLILSDVNTQISRKIPISALENAVLRAVVVDEKGNIWLTAHGKNRIWRASADFSKQKFMTTI